MEVHIMCGELKKLDTNQIVTQCLQNSTFSGGVLVCSGLYLVVSLMCVFYGRMLEYQGRKR